MAESGSYGYGTAEMRKTTTNYGEMRKTLTDYSTTRMRHTSSYGEGQIKQTTTRTTSHMPHVRWNNNHDSRAQEQLTARPHESPKYATLSSTRQFEWPKKDDNNSDEENCCKCCPSYK